MIVPISSEQNRPCAMAPSASMRYRLTEISMSFLFRNALKLSMRLPFLSSVFFVNRSNR